MVISCLFNSQSSAEESFDEEEENVLDLQAARLRLQQQDTLDKEVISLGSLLLYIQ